MSDLKLVSVNVGMPRNVEWHGRLVLTSLFKSPVLGPVRVATLNLEEQADLSKIAFFSGVKKASVSG